MSQGKRFSDEFLNAFVDNQLAPEEKSRAFIEISQDENLNRQVCELRKMHDLVQHAYREPPAPPTSKSSGPGRARINLRFGAVASVLLLLGIVAGREIRLPTPNLNSISARASATEDTEVMGTYRALSTTAAKTSVPDAKQARVLIHVAHDDTAELGQALDDIEGLLTYYREKHQNARVEVVLNGKGLGLVRVDTSKFAKRISRLQKTYKNLTFAACQNTIDRLKREEGVTVRLLPGVTVIDSGMAEIMRRQNQGWTYLQV
jgi:intracellular sulfur oxidation DsrE/DsrF family protein